MHSDPPGRSGQLRAGAEGAKVGTGKKDGELTGRWSIRYTLPVTGKRTHVLAPDHPKLFDFIEFWQREIEGPLHSVRFTHRKMIAPGEWRNVVGEFRVN